MQDKIREYSKNTHRFHMPGHSGANIDGELYDVAKYDITELSFSDNLQCPTGDIKALQERIAKIYQVKKSLVLTEGATAGIQVALLIAREMRGELYLLGETHKSCISFASIIGLTIVSVESIDEAISKVQEGKWVYVTTPNYYGEVIDIARLLEARRDGACVIVDEAHGAHFVFSKRLPDSVSSCADFTIESLHKTLPVFTGGAVLNIANGDYVDMAEYFKNKIHSTSPSYLIMQSIDKAMSLMSERGEELYDEVFLAIEDFEEHLDDRYKIVHNDDRTRVVISCDDAESVNEYLEANDVYIELCDANRLVLIVTPFNYEYLEDVSELLANYSGQRAHLEEATPLLHTKRARGYKGELRFVDIASAKGLVSMSEVAIYPPGVPLIRSGDIIQEEAIAFILGHRDKIVGLIGDTIAVREICEEN